MPTTTAHHSDRAGDRNLNAARHGAPDFGAELTARVATLRATAHVPAALVDAATAQALVWAQEATEAATNDD